jgi:hypothetical protein
MQSSFSSYDRIIRMDTNPSPPVKDFLPAAFFLMVTGGAGLFLLIFYTLPTVGPRWLFFFLGVFALTGTALPVMAFINRRFPSLPPPTHGVVVRQALWCSVYITTLAWLQIGRVLSITLAVLLAVGLILIEFLLRMGERSQWKPS